MHNPIMELYLYAKRQIENVKACPGTWKVDMMKFEECENHYETCQESLK